MKANRQFTAIITVLFIGFSTLNGQASARTGNRDKQEGHTIKRTEARQVQQRQVQAKGTTARVTQARQTQARQTTANAYTGPNQKSITRYNQTASRPVMAHNKPAKNNTVHNIKVNHGAKANHHSNYSGGNAKRPMKENKYSKERYYSGHHYHHAYPSTKIRTHYHHDTHIHHYNVLYYPAYHEIYWNRSMYRDYNRWYPNYRWRYNYGYRVQTFSIFDAKYNLGEVALIYGRVYASWHNKETDDYLLFFGGDYPGQQFTVVLPGRIARKFSWRPERYFLGEHMTVTGLITTFDGIPEIIVKNRTQIGIY